MALQDLTPQLRTRLSRVERAVGWFVFLATALLIFGFGYYVYHTAESRGWFKIKAPFFTIVQSSTGLSPGNAVVMMGFPVGKIISVEPGKPEESFNVKVKFYIQEPYFRYIRTQGSYIRLNSGLLGTRQLEITRGSNAPGSYAVAVTQPISVMSLDDARKTAAADPDHWQLSQDVFDDHSNIVFHAYDYVSTVLDPSNAATLAHCYFESNSIYIYDNPSFTSKDHIVASWHKRTHRYENFTPNSDDAWLKTIEAPAIGDQAQAMITEIQNALPGILALTNKIAAVLDNAANATSNLNKTLVAVQPLVTNATDISGQLREPGGLAVWALGANGNSQVQGALTNLNTLLVNTDTNLNALSDQFGQTLMNVANITSNLNVQVQNDPQMLFGISKLVTDTDDFVQGLKRHWLLRSAFKTKTKTTNAPAVKSPALKK